MSYFSGQLRRLLEQGHTQASLADAAKIPQGQFSKYVNDKARPDRDSFRRLCDILGDFDRAQVARAYLQDEVPESAHDLVAVLATLSPKEETATARVSERTTLSPTLREAFDFFERAAEHDSDIADWIVSSYKVVKPDEK